MPRFVLFDLFHTLVSGSVPQWREAAAEVAAIIGVEPEAMLAAYEATWRQRQVEWTTEETIRNLANRLGRSPTPAQVTRAAAVRLALARRILSAAQGPAAEVLDSLRADGYRLGLVSNATADTAEAWPGSGLAPRFDAAMFSCEVGAAKPDPKIYLAATTALGARPDECFYVGDGADHELAAAAALGMTVFRTTQYHNSDPTWSGPAVSSLADLPALLP